MKYLNFIISILFFYTSHSIAQEVIINVNIDTIDYSIFKPRTRFILDIDYGFDTFLSKNNKKSDVNYPELDLWPSLHIGFSFNGKTRMFGNKSVMYIKYGLGLKWANYVVKGDYLLKKNEGKPTYSHDDIERNLLYSGIRNLYMELPVMFQLDFSEKKTDKSFKIGIGAYAGVRWYTWQTLTYKDKYGDFTKATVRNRFFVNPFNYGVQSEIGYKSISIFTQYNMSNFFDKNENYDYTALKFGFKTSI
ncbi:MAG: hypothetical protein KAG96_02980 [Ichthyobacteriaceae bacterium]|nr:hypothetical protein [Ichthyobacteriaceae bacterium]